MGGLALKTLKKLKGDKFGLPSESMVLAKAMGLGATEESNQECSWAVGVSDGIIVNNVLDFLTKIANI